VSLLNEDLHEALMDNIQTADAETDYWIGLHRARWIWDASGKLSVPVLCGTLKKYADRINAEICSTAVVNHSDRQGPSSTYSTIPSRGSIGDS